MDIVDIVGKNAVANIIENQNFSKFSILKYGSHANAFPLFESLDSSNNKQARENFLFWADNVESGGNNNSCYEIVCFNDFLDDVETDIEETEKTTKKKKGSKSNKIRFSFCLQARGESDIAGLDIEQIKNDIKKEVGNLKPILTTTDVENIVSKAVGSLLNEQKNNETIEMLADISERLEFLEDSKTESPAEKSQIAELIDLFNKVKDTNKVTEKKPENAETTISGNDTNEFTANIKKALKILVKYDKQIDTDLITLSNIAQNNTEYFNTLIQALRKL